MRAQYESLNQRLNHFANALTEASRSATGDARRCRWSGIAIAARIVQWLSLINVPRHISQTREFARTDFRSATQRRPTIYGSAAPSPKIGVKAYHCGQ